LGPGEKSALRKTGPFQVGGGSLLKLQVNPSFIVIADFQVVIYSDIT
jgi:putative NADH-flavin reductase